MEKLLKTAIFQLLDYCRANNWAGYDPYDGLNSRIFSVLPFTNNRTTRLIFIQSFKRLPINLRPVFLIPREQNPKGIALFCSALLKLANLEWLNDDRLILELLDRLVEMRSPEKPYCSWGYNFDWQSRYFMVPKNEPNIVTTSFAGHAIIDAYERFGEQKYLDLAGSAGDFILKGLNITGNGDKICFSYTPLDQEQVHNANLLGAAYLARLYSKTNKKEFLDFSLKAARFSVNRQNEDGSWFYGEHESQRWIDNFHTGYNLIVLKNFCTHTRSKEFTGYLQKGYEYYISSFFTENSLPKYYHDQLYPIDIHSIAQSIITLVELKHLDQRSIDLACFILKWAITNMQDKKGYFYYQKKQYYKNKIPYMRWSQAWMLYAMSIFAEKFYSLNARS